MEIHKKIAQGLQQRPEMFKTSEESDATEAQWMASHVPSKMFLFAPKSASQQASATQSTLAAKLSLGKKRNEGLFLIPCNQLRQI